MSIVLKANNKARVQTWFDVLKAALPDAELRLWPDCGDPAKVEFVIASDLPPGAFATFPNLKFIACMAVGLDGLLGDPTIPAHIPFVRSVNKERGDTMAEYVVLHALRHFRQQPDYEANQRQARWQRRLDRSAADFGIGVMGLGNLGRAAAEKLRLFGFPVAAWTRSPRDAGDIEIFAGRDRLPAFLARSRLVVCLLPLTAETRDILDARAFAAMPKGAYLINAGRGEELVEDDLLAALGSGQLAGATLDVFRTEPLPADHPFWQHPKVTVTPHNSAATVGAHGADVILDNIRRARAGLPLVNTVDKAAGY
ncbi:MAG TPA: glyoxylate/hydroxypyruvate reductase A [Alphaproteobacteria bacterium]|jgi:glyoxylate/hydroxypyruvate reductase A